MTSFPSASGLQRAVMCRASTVLPRSTREASSFTQERIDFHAFVDAVNKKGVEAALAEVPADLAFAYADMDMTGLPTDPTAYATEVAFAYDPTTGLARELNRKGGRDYSAAKASEFVGTADAVALLGDDAVVVLDIKPRYNSSAPPAKDNWQLKFLALCMAKLHQRSRAIVELVHADAFGSWRDRAEFDAFDLDTIASELWDLASRILTDREKGDAPSSEGSWCRYCESFTACPAKKTLALSLAAGNDGVGATLTRDNAGRAWARLKLARQVLDRVEEALEEFAREEPFITPDGMLVSANERRVESIDGDIAAPVLDKLGLGACVESKVSKTAITKLAGKAKAPEIIEALRKAGAVKVSISTPVTERKAS